MSGKREGVGAVAVHTDMQGFRAHHGEERVERRHSAAEVADPLYAKFHGVGRGREITGIDRTVVAFVGIDEFREFAVFPVESAFFHDDAADAGRMAVKIFCRGVGDNIRSEVERAAKIRGRERIVDDQRKPVFVSDACEFFHIQYDQRGIREHFRKDRFRARTDRRFQFGFRRFRGDEREVEPRFLQRIGKKRHRAAVKAGHGENVIAAAGDVQKSQRVGVLSGTGGDSHDAAFQSGDFLFKTVHGRVGEAGVEKAGAFQVEEIGDALSVVVLVGCALHDRLNARSAVFGFVSRLNGDCFKFPVGGIHSLYSLKCFVDEFSVDESSRDASFRFIAAERGVAGF